jgi:hypothetical protein
VIMLCGLAFFFYRSAQDEDRAHQAERTPVPG